MVKSFLPSENFVFQTVFYFTKYGGVTDLVLGFTNLLTWCCFSERPFEPSLYFPNILGFYLHEGIWCWANSDKLRLILYVLIPLIPFFCTLSFRYKVLLSSNAVITDSFSSKVFWELSVSLEATLAQAPLSFSSAKCNTWGLNTQHVFQSFHCIQTHGDEFDLYFLYVNWSE